MAQSYDLTNDDLADDKIGYRSLFVADVGAGTATFSSKSNTMDLCFRLQLELI